MNGSDDRKRRKLIKVGVHRGGGSARVYAWEVLVLDIAYDEAMKFLNRDQYQHVAEQVKELARLDDPTHSDTLSIDSIEQFHELRDKGGILGKINVRVFFHVDKRRSAIIVLGAINKQNDGQTRNADKIRMRRRLRKYLNGEFDGVQ